MYHVFSLFNFNKQNMEQSITKSNALIEAGYRLSLTEMQIVLYGISLINPLQKDFPLKYAIDVKRVSDIFNRSHGQIYNEIKDAITKRFWERDFSYIDENGKTVTNRWLTQISYHDATGFMQIKFSEEIQPYLHQLKKHFTTYYIGQIAEFKSVYSIRLYEYAIMRINKSKQNKCQFSLLIDDLKRRLEISDKYPRFSNFKATVLERAKKEMNKYSDLNLTYKIVKLGRSPNKIEFTVTRKAEKTLTHQKPTSDKLSPAMIEQAKAIVRQAGTGWDLYAIEQQFYDYIRQKGNPSNLEGAFIGFVKKKVLE